MAAGPDYAQAITQGMVLVAILAGFALSAGANVAAERPFPQHDVPRLVLLALTSLACLVAAWTGILYFVSPDRGHTRLVLWGAFLGLLLLGGGSFLASLVLAVRRLDQDGVGAPWRGVRACVLVAGALLLVLTLGAVIFAWF